MCQLLCFKSKFPNHFAFTLGYYLFMLFLVQFIGSVRRIETMHQRVTLIPPHRTSIIRVFCRPTMAARRWVSGHGYWTWSVEQAPESRPDISPRRETGPDFGPDNEEL
jgi:hypothetical protein